MLSQGSRTLVWVTAIHLSLIVSFFSVLVWLGLLGFQLVEDGTLASLGLLTGLTGILAIGSAYIFLDTAFGITHYFQSKPPSHLYSPWTFSLVILWPLIACLIYACATTIVVLHRLGERRPLIYTFGAAITLALAEASRYGLSHTLCRRSSGSVDGSFLGTFLETAALGWLLTGWVAITEANWDEFEAWDPGSTHGGQP
ncbi:hypothetical protein CROQUDRAFT_49140 [Cronartium quercuum f. sp. fusiforme G11]|uniref:Chitin synthase export chaperone n=1 Tax=Cronartium quercuum f. sp. fusiforme G11 TaxID=708437 RepID=A0A9P6T953_9BASI|nr:hypothetical protein CROQUDRAFT_49140 [Cronartium quercuum f. sp. fusiforme G11]